MTRGGISQGSRVALASLERPEMRPTWPKPFQTLKPDLVLLILIAAAVLLGVGASQGSRVLLASLGRPELLPA